MTRHSSRAKWNTANTRLANKPFDDLFAQAKPDPDAAIIDLIKQIPADDYPEELQAARRLRFVARVRERNGDPVDVEKKPDEHPAL
jgi:hypothetical protein